MSQGEKPRKRFLSTHSYFSKVDDEWMESIVNQNGFFVRSVGPAKEPPKIEVGVHVVAFTPRRGGARVDDHFSGPIVAKGERDGTTYVLIAFRGRNVAVPESTVAGVRHERLDHVPDVSANEVEAAIDRYIADVSVGTTPDGRPIVVQQVPSKPKRAHVDVSTTTTFSGNATISVGRASNTTATPVRSATRPRPEPEPEDVHDDGNGSGAGVVQVILSGAEVDLLVDALRIAIAERRGENFGIRARRMLEQLKAARPAQEPPKEFVRKPNESTVKVVEAPTEASTDLPSKASDATEEGSRSPEASV